jgi:anti-sigma factor RsiW
MTEISDELLVAYVDGQLARAQSRAVERVIEQDDVAAQRVAALREAQERLEAAFEAILAGEAEALAPSAPPRRAKQARTGLTRLAGLAGLLLLAGGVGFALHAYAPNLPGLAPPAPAGPAVPGGWQEEAARAHSLLGRESLELGLESQGNADLMSMQLGHLFGYSVNLPSLDADGFSFKRLQFLRHEGAVIAQILYLPEEGPPLALYAKPDGAPSPRSFARYGSAGAVSWSEAGIAYVLAGAYARPELTRLSQIIAAALARDSL